MTLASYRTVAAGVKRRRPSGRVPV
jgi:hypothetical protein